jgi:hypothetical protein
MNAKKSLGNRIRGWFPQEPYMISTRFKVENIDKRQPPIIPPGYNVSSTKVAGIVAILYIIIYGFSSFYNLNFEEYAISVFQGVAWIIFGVAAGTISSIIFTQNQLGRLLKDYQFSTNGQDLVLLIVPLVLFSIFVFFVSFSFNGIMHITALQGCVISVFAYGVSMLIIRYVLFLAFEKNENMRLMQSWGGKLMILIPKAPESNVNQTKMNTKN